MLWKTNLETGGCSILKVLTKKKLGTTEAIWKTVCQTGELQNIKLQIPTIHHNALWSTTVDCHGKHQCLLVTIRYHAGHWSVLCFSSTFLSSVLYLGNPSAWFKAEILFSHASWSRTTNWSKSWWLMHQFQIIWTYHDTHILSRRMNMK